MPKLGGIGVGMAGGFGMFVAVLLFGIPPGPIPLDVILIIMSVLFACSVMHIASGMDYMIHVASWILRSNPKYINILAPAIAFTLTIFLGTGFMVILNAIFSSPISVATAAMYVVVEGMGVSFRSALMVILLAGLVSMTSKEELEKPLP